MTNKLRGMRFHPNHRQLSDQSDFAVHLTQDGGQSGAGDNFVSILRDKRLEARNKFGLGRHLELCGKSACFTETPIQELKRIAARKSDYGLGFHKITVTLRGGGPVFYAYGECGDAMSELMELAKSSPENPIWRVAPFIEQPNAEVGFEWEREWRVPGNFNFEPSDVRFLIAPEAEHPDIKEYLANLEAEEGFPQYRCKLIDHLWEADKIRGELR
jgi:hypothetical protein